MERSQTLTILDMVMPKRRLLVEILVILGFAIITAASAQIGFWIGPVPITGQTFAVLITGAILGSRRAAISQMSYLAIGLTGIPFWFTPGGAMGVARLIGPTGGYLIGFIFAAFAVGWFAERGWNKYIWTAALAMLAGEFFIYLFGVAWLGWIMPADKAVEVGLIPFIVGDIIKICAAALVLPAGYRLVGWLKTHSD